MTMTNSFASESDHRECSRLHRKYGTTYFFASRRLPADVRRAIDAVYGFVRVPDEWVDNPRTDEMQTPQELLAEYRKELLSANYGVRPNYGVLRAFCDVVNQKLIPLEEPILFLDAMEQDLHVNRYETYEDLRLYMRGSAVSVGLMLLRVFDAPNEPDLIEGARQLAEAMQMTNFLRDFGEDADRGRVYFPLDEIQRFGLRDDIQYCLEHQKEWNEFAKFQIARIRELFAGANLRVKDLPRDCQFGVQLASTLYEKILDHVESNDYNVFRGRLMTTPREKMIAAWQLWANQL